MLTTHRLELCDGRTSRFSPRLFVLGDTVWKSTFQRQRSYTKGTKPSSLPAALSMFVKNCTVYSRCSIKLSMSLQEHKRKVKYKQQYKYTYVVTTGQIKFAIRVAKRQNALFGVVKVQTRPGRVRISEFLVQRLTTVMSRPNGDPLHVQKSAQIRRMHTLVKKGA